MICILSSVLVLLQPSAEADPANQLKPVEGVTVQTWAETPMVMDPVAFCLDDKGRVYVAESFRQEHGVEDNRSQPYWLLDDLAATRIEDRLAKYEKWSDRRTNGMGWYTEKEDRIRRVQDTDGDGLADEVTMFADGFRAPLDGTGAGLMMNGNELWYTCIPHLWRLPDQDEDGTSDQREPIFTGFGVRDALRGHDMHGLVWGPDGRIYWSIGDRGYHVTRSDGKVLADPRSGAVFRCEPDGTNLELFYTGLRNPQELAFDHHGYLFTGDNNSDGGDRARIVYCPEAGQSGWEMNYQTLAGENNRGPWVQEGIWETDHEGRPAWVLPPLKHVGSGPSGFVAYPGQGLSSRYDNNFFMCNFLGSPQHSEVLAIEVLPEGAGFQVGDVHPFVKGVLCTDVDFDWDGSMMVSDWVSSWVSQESGRLFRLRDTVHGNTEATTAAAELMASGLEKQSTPALVQLLSSADARIRLRSQYELARRVATDELAAIATDPEQERMSRIHAIWGLGMIGRRHQGDADSHPLEQVRTVAWDDDAEIRSQAARVLGDESYSPAAEDLMGLAFDENPRVVYQAIMGLGRLGDPDSFDAIIEMLWTNDNQDVWLRHAGVVALTRIDDRERLIELLGDPMPSIRLAAVLALRRLGDPAVARVLRDPDPLIAAEAARAINDVPIIEAESALADLLPTLMASGSAESMPVTWEIFEDVPVLTSEELGTHPVFDRKPDEIREMDGFLVASGDRDEYASRMTGRIVPASDGEHRFAITSDDHSALYAWPEDRPEQREQIAFLDQWTPLDAWESRPGQVSEPIQMKAGEAWILEARHSEGGGGDHLAVGWQEPGGQWNRPIGVTQPDRTHAALVRRAMSASLRDGDATRIQAVADVALDSGQGDVLRREAMETIRQWPAPLPRERVQGRYRPVEGVRDVAGWKAVMERTLPALAESDQVVAIPARAIAEEHGIALDPAMLFKTLEDESIEVAQRVSTLRLLTRREESRERAIDLAMNSVAALRAEGLLAMSLHDPVEALPLAREAIDSDDLSWRRAGIESLAIIDQSEAEELLLDRLNAIEGEHPAVALDVLEAARRRGGMNLTPAVRKWSEGSEGAMAPAYAMTDEGGDASRGRDLVFYHAGASCLRCHVIDGTGGAAGPDLSDVGRRLDTTSIVRSLLEPQAEVAEGYGEASAMPAMATYLTPMQIRDVVAYLQTLKPESN